MLLCLILLDLGRVLLMVKNDGHQYHQWKFIVHSVYSAVLSTKFMNVNTFFS